MYENTPILKLFLNQLVDWVEQSSDILWLDIK